MSTELILAPIPDVAITVTPEWENKKAQYLVTTKAITAVATAEDQEKASIACQLINADLKAIEKARKELTEKPLKIQRDLMTVKKNACKELEDEVGRIGGLVLGFQRKEAERVRLENEKRQKEEADRLIEIAKAHAEAQRIAQEAQKAALNATKQGTTAADEEFIHQANLAMLAQEELDQKKKEFQAAAAMPAVAPVKVKGNAVRKVLKWEIIDSKKVFETHPTWFTLEPKRGVINDSLSAGQCIEGMKIWEEDDITFRAAR